MVPVKVDLVSGGGSMILPGDRVDVMVHLAKAPDRDIQETVTRIILQDIKVFAVDDVVDLERDKEGRKSIAAKTISLLVTPEQAAKVMLAAQLGIINLVMRSPEDDAQAANAQARPSELFGITAKAERSRESLDGAPEQGLTEKTKGFLDFLNNMKGNPPGSRRPQNVEDPKSRETWTIRVLKPNGADEVTFEADPAEGAGPSPFGPWKKMPATSSLNGPQQSADGDPRLGVPSAQATPASPPDARPQSKQDAKEKKRDPV